MNKLNNLDLVKEVYNRSGINIPSVYYNDSENNDPIAVKHKPTDISGLWKAASELQSSLSINYENLLTQTLRKLNNEFDDYFRSVLAKYNITEEEWKAEGMIECHCGVNKCFYKGKEIFWYSEKPVFKMEEQTEGTITYYYGEPIDAKSNFSL